MRSFTRRAFAASTFVAAVAATGVASPAVAAPDALGTPVGRITLTAKSADVGIGYTWGDGTLTYGHRTYHFKVSGGNIAAVGYSKLEATGTVYNLKNLHDFDGGYGALNGDATLDRGIGGAVLSNSNGVKIKFTSATRGAHLAAGGQGLSFKLAE
ncbi:hypothetical protein [Kozakia baliensis]|uniref:Uncharacterized protein n=1 Tax=Kozakia baliensis TaxID=153496 RepID=A0A1D8UVB3_9PROT|nr:hypothetical protein [Kozakia baliensis]AOX17581.1 hypothetical protein A0U89_10985 [Kozakia baliensis]GBR31063.1 hypothetical protein AA0488_2177 [Kozakia baliensis NRIC 0488]GEL62938.1 hypothetical protein KBA01_02240 [Kozakia baliensis]